MQKVAFELDPERNQDSKRQRRISGMGMASAKVWWWEIETTRTSTFTTIPQPNTAEELDIQGVIASCQGDELGWSRRRQGCDEAPD